MINLIAAVGENGEIGYRGRIPWLDDPDITYTADMAWFAKQTGTGALIVGGRTYREMSRMGYRPGYRYVYVWNGMSRPGHFLGSVEREHPEIWICGGEHTYKAFMPFVERFYISRVPWTGRADAFLPPILPNYERVT